MLPKEAINTYDWDKDILDATSVAGKGKYKYT
jgi:hypothetical protein